MVLADDPDEMLPEFEMHESFDMKAVTPLSTAGPAKPSAPSSTGTGMAQASKLHEGGA